MKSIDSRPTASVTKAADLAAAEIRRQIQDGFLAPGQRLIEAELMDFIGLLRRFSSR